MDKVSDLILSAPQAVAYMTREIAHICRHMKKRAPGSDGEYEAGLYMAGILRDECGCKEVRVERFGEHPAAFYGYCRISAFFDALSGLGFFIHPALGLAAGCVALTLFVLCFVMYKPILDPLFPRREGTNVTAIRPTREKPRRRLLLNGHIDASWEFTLNYHFGGIVFEIPNLMALIGVVFNVAIALCALAGAAFARRAALWGLLFLPFFVAIYFVYNPRQVVDGANDNLTGCYMGIALLREMERRGLSLKDTELGVLLTGSEEAGLRGAKAWCRAHRDQFSDIPTYIVAFDTIHDPRFLAVNVRDLNGTLKSDEGLAEAFLKAANDVGVPCRRGQVPLFGGGTDSAAFTQAGFRSIGITGLNHKLEDYYHTRRDSDDNLNAEGLENCYRATVRLVERVDEGLVEGK